MDNSLKLILNHFSRISSNQLVRYYSNPHSYYKEYIIGREKKFSQFEEQLDQEIGSQVHSFLEHLYKPFLGKDIFKDDIVHLPYQVEDLVYDIDFIKDNRFFLGSDDEEIQNSLRKIHKKVSNILESDIESLQKDESLKIMELESRMKLTLSIQGSECDVHSFVDRIEYKSGRTRLMDYRSNVFFLRTEIQKFEDLTSLKEVVLHPSFGIRLNTWMYWKLVPSSEEVIDYIIINSDEPVQNRILVPFSSESCQRFDLLIKQIISDVHNNLPTPLS